MRGNRGFALVLTLVVTALMVAVTAELIHQVYVDTSLSRGFRDGQQASLLAESGIEGGIKYLKFRFPTKDKYTTLIDPLKQEDETGTIEIKVVEESGKINLNLLVPPSGAIDTFTQNALLRLGKRLKIPDDVWVTLADWLDSDNVQPSNGAETTYYQALKPPYVARNGWLRSVEELSLVKGFTPDIIARLRPFVTVHYDPNITISSQQININSAPLEVLTALADSIDNSMAERIIAERRRNPFTEKGTITRIPGGTAASNDVGKYVIYKGTVFRIISQSRVKDSSRTVEAVVRLTDEKILSWQEY